jgi:SAM-dependent methyltransferase
MVGIFCPACGRGSAVLAPGPGGRPAAACPHCGSLERHRLLALLLQVVGPRLAGARVLDVAPSPHTTPLLQRTPLGQLIGMDFDPAADGRAVDVQASVTDLPFGDAVLDFALCYHVFEHVPDDRRGMRELARVLAPTGLALVQVPWRPNRDTDEETSTDGQGPGSAAERIRRFGQADHVRYYGRETFDERLRESGLEAVRFLVSDLLAPPMIARLGLRADEAGWLVRPALAGAGAGGGTTPLAETLRSWVIELLGPDGDRLPDLLPELVAVSTAEAELLRQVAGLRAEVAGLRAGTGRQRAEIARLRTELARSRPTARVELTRAAHAVESALPEPVRQRLRGSGVLRAVRRRLR